MSATTGTVKKVAGLIGMAAAATGAALGFASGTGAADTTFSQAPMLTTTFTFSTTISVTSKSFTFTPTYTIVPGTKSITIPPPTFTVTPGTKSFTLSPPTVTVRTKTFTLSPPTVAVQQPKSDTKSDTNPSPPTG